MAKTVKVAHNGTTPPTLEYVSLEYLAETLGVTKRRISQFKEEKIIVPAARGQYEKEVALRSLFAWYRDKLDKPAKPSDAMEYEKLRRMTAQAEREEMRVMQEKGELHHTEDMAAIFGNIFSRVHSGLESFPLGIAPLLTDNPDAMDIATKIKEHLNKTLYEMTSFDFDLFIKTGGKSYVSALEEAENVPA
jgi:phage terminase Nu1 subunit (DNA packaging protein)